MLTDACTVMRTRPRYLATLSSLLLGVAALLCLVLSCDESFNPSAAFQPRMVVYSILTTDSDTQYVRVYSSFNPPDNDPTRNQDEISVTDAQVSISQQGGPTFTFQPRTIERLDKSRYASAVRAYCAYPFRPEKGKKYILTVSSSAQGTLSATTTVPGSGSITPINPDVISLPYYTDKDYGFSATLAPESKGFLIRFYVDYLSPLPGEKYEPRRFEVPVRRDVISYYYEIYRKVYPQPTLRTTARNPERFIYSRELRSEERVTYARSAYAPILDWEIYELQGCGVRFVQGVFYLMQFDDPLWNYWSVSNSFRDKLSVRTDEPDYSNIKGGLGVFGSVTVDSLVWSLPEKIPPPPHRGTLGCQ